MEPAAAAWGEPGPCGEYQLATSCYWSVEEAAAQVWAPAAGGLPAAVEDASVVVDIFDSYSSLQAYVPPPPEPSDEQGQQLVEYYCEYAAASQHYHPNGETTTTKFSDNSRASCEFKQLAGKFKDDVNQIEMKMHRFPASLAAVDKCYTEPWFVAIGPYHHGEERLQKAEKWKHMAAYDLVHDSGRSLEEVYGAVVSAADYAGRLYDKDVMAEIDEEDFRHMMFFDACFLVECVRMLAGHHKRGRTADSSLHHALNTVYSDLSHDLLLLENQIPWKVVKAVTKFGPSDPFEDYIASRRGCLQDRKDDEPETPFVWDESYEPPHLLGLLRYYIVGRSGPTPNKTPPQGKGTKSISFSVSAIELAEIGITLTPNTTTPELIDMDLRYNNTGTLFPELFLAPLSLDQNRANRLVNMAAFEVCSVVNFGAAQDSAVCSYLLLLAMLVHREDDVRELRARGLLQGGGGLSDQEALRFFTSLQNLRLGSRYLHIMREIQRYRVDRPMLTGLHAFLYNNMKTIAAVVSGIGAVGGIIGTLVSLKGAL